MPLFLIGTIGAVVAYYYFTRGNPLAQIGGRAQAPSGTRQPTYARSSGSVPGTIPPGITLPGQSVEGPGPNTMGALLSTGVGTGASFAAMAASTAGITAAGAAVAGVGALIGVGMALWAAHCARVKGAKDENAVLNELVPNFSGALTAEFASLNQGQISATTALQDLEQIRLAYWNAIAPYQKGPGQHTHPCNPLTTQPDTRGDYYVPSAQCSQTNKANRYSQATVCDKTCTAGCCIGCDYIEPSICSAKWLIQNGGGTVNIPSVAGSKYGYAGQSGFSITYQAGGAVS